MKKIINILSFALLLGGCSGFLEEYSQDLAKIQSYEDLDEILLGEGYLPYARITSQGVIENEYFQCVHYMSDELSKYIPIHEYDPAGLQEKMFGWHTWQQVVGLKFEGGQHVEENRDWKQAYISINACNSILTEIGKQVAESDREKLEIVRIKGESAFLRALYYFQLVNLYGKPYCADNLSSPGVPLKLSQIVEDKDYTCATVEEVYSQILKDLKLAEECLSQTAKKNFPYRADIAAVYLLKSRVFLYMQNWKDALAYAQKTLNVNGNLLDLKSFSGEEVLEESSPEIIFSMGGYVLAYSIQTFRGMSNNIWKNCPGYVISDDLVKAFDDEGKNDLRTRFYISKDTVGYKGDRLSIPYTEAWTFRKVLGWVTSPRNLSDNFLFRTAEAYLNGAEAAALAGEETEARSLLKTLRDHCLLVSRPITESGQALVDLIRLERQRELCLDGHRWFDLRRYTVREKYPYTKTIMHTYTKYKYDSRVFAYVPLETWSYELKENDPAYTLALPKEVLDFQPSLGSNSRPVRQGSVYTAPATPEVTPPNSSLESNPIYKEGFLFGGGKCFSLNGQGSPEAFYDQCPYEPYSNNYNLWCKGVKDGWEDALKYLGGYM